MAFASSLWICLCYRLSLYENLFVNYGDFYVYYGDFYVYFESISDVLSVAESAGIWAEDLFFSELLSTPDSG
jgi:hypothetical protein